MHFFQDSKLVLKDIDNNTRENFHLSRCHI